MRFMNHPYFIFSIWERLCRCAGSLKAINFRKKAFKKALRGLTKNPLKTLVVHKDTGGDISVPHPHKKMPFERIGGIDVCSAAEETTLPVPELWKRIPASKSYYTTCSQELQPRFDCASPETVFGREYFLLIATYILRSRQKM